MSASRKRACVLVVCSSTVNWADVVTPTVVGVGVGAGVATKEGAGVMDGCGERVGLEVVRLVTFASSIAMSL